MGMLADQVDHIIGVDTHRDSHSAAAVSPTVRSDGMTSGPMR